MPQVDLAIPAFGYKNHIAIDRAHRLIRKWTATHAAAHDGAWRSSSPSARGESILLFVLLLLAAPAPSKASSNGLDGPHHRLELGPPKSVLRGRRIHQLQRWPGAVNSRNFHASQARWSVAAQ